ncbi:SDR family oxidoreductase [Candidatus Kapabacteria bacterium]|nr:SDR family oxidoreductase [Candidatus Kapabacteria bacterium]
MNLNLENKTAIVCGSTQGIGKAAAIELAKLGANVHLLARNKERLLQTKSELPNNGHQNHGIIIADFSNHDEVKTAISNFTKFFEAQILVNNTGGPPAGKIIDASSEEFLNAYNLHLINNHYLVQSLLSGMKKAKYGRIINVISTSVKAPIAGLGVSNTTRGAVANWAKTLANELGEFNITVNNVLPGLTDTERLSSLINSKAEKSSQSIDQVESQMKNSVPMKRFATAEECANAIAFLASPAANYINGINLPVDGGRTASL